MADRYRILFVDGHNSHCTVAFLDFAFAHNIIVISYPPHCTHGLQGLDVACFGALKVYWTQARRDFERSSGGAGVTKSEFLRVYHATAIKAFTPETIRSVFAAAGVWPFVRGAVPPTAMEPSLVSSTLASFPLPMTPPVKMVMAAFHNISPEAGPSNSQPGLGGIDGVPMDIDQVVRRLALNSCKYVHISEHRKLREARAHWRIPLQRGQSRPGLSEAIGRSQEANLTCLSRIR